MNAFFMTQCPLSEIPICDVKKVALNTPENASCKNAKLLVNSRATCVFEVFLTANFQVKLFKVSKLVLLQLHTLKQCKL